MTVQLPISLCIQTHNAAPVLSGCIESCRGWVSEIIVGDMESTDATVAIAEASGAAVLRIPHVGFVEPGRQLTIEQARQPWVLLLDADERARPGFWSFAASRVELAGLNAVWLPRSNLVLGRELRHTGFWPDYQLRLFRRGTVTWPPSIHAVPTATGRVEHAESDPAIAIEHLAYASLHEMVGRHNRYTTIEAERLAQRAFALRRVLSSPIREFVSRYVLQRGFLDGPQGLVMSIMMASYVQQAEMKCWELRGFDRRHPAHDATPADAGRT